MPRPHEAGAGDSTSDGTRDHGYATVWAVGWMTCALTVGWWVLLVAVAVARQHHVDGSADLVSLSAADALQRGDDPCATAARLAEANQVRLADCVIDGDDVVVTVHDPLDLPLDLHVDLVGRSRAGPA